MKYKKKVTPKVKQPYTEPITTIPGVSPNPVGLQQYPNGGLINNIQLGLDAAQFVPVLGEAAYLASLPFTTYDVAKELYKGNYKQAGMDALGYIPGLKAFKYGLKGGKILDTTSKLAKQYNKVNNVVNATNLANDAAKMKKADGGELLGLRDIKANDLELVSKTGGFMLNDKSGVLTKSNFINASKFGNGGLLNSLPKYDGTGKSSNINFNPNFAKTRQEAEAKFDYEKLHPEVVEKRNQERTIGKLTTNLNKGSEIYQTGSKKGQATGKGGLEESLAPWEVIFPATDVAGAVMEGAAPLMKAGLKLGAKVAKPIIEKTKPYVEKLVNTGLNVVNTGLDEVYNFKYRKEIADLPKIKRELLQEINTPEGYKRLRDQGIDAKSFLDQLNKTPVKSIRKKGSWDNSEIINIDFDQLKRLKKQGYNLDTKSVLDHEIGHRMQRGFNSKIVNEYNQVIDALPNSDKVNPYYTYSTPLDKESAELLAPLTKNMKQDDADYFFQGSDHHERLPFLREAKREMKKAGYINNIYDKITPEITKKFLKETPNNRFAKFLQTDQPLTHRRLSSLLNKTPILTGAVLGTKTFQQEDKKQYGGMLPKFGDGGETGTVNKPTTTSKRVQSPNKYIPSEDKQVNFAAQLIQSPLFGERLKRQLADPNLSNFAVKREQRKRMGNLAYLTPFDSESRNIYNPQDYKKLGNEAEMAKMLEGTYGQYDRDNHAIYMNVSKKDPEYYPTLSHELSHATTRGNLTIKDKPYVPTFQGEEFNKLYKSQIEKMPKGSEMLKDFDRWAKKHNEFLQTTVKEELSKPTEIKARVDAARKALFENKLYDARKENFTPEHYEKMKTLLDNQGVRELLNMFPKEEVVRMMNNIAYNKSGKSTSMPTMAKHGGWLDKL